MYIALSAVSLMSDDNDDELLVTVTAAGLPIALIIGVTVALFLIILIVVIIVAVLFIRRRRRQSPTEDIYDIHHVPYDKGTLFPANSTKPIPFNKFCEHVDQLAKNSNLEYANEFEVRTLNNLLYSYY